MKKIILCGFNWSGCRALDLLIKRNYEVYVYTHKSPWHINDLIDFCKYKNVKFSTEKISIENLPFNPDIIISVFYRYIISEEVINKVNKKIFNLHPSLLPKYRGCSSTTWAIINGESHSGFTYHYIEKGVDEGNIIIQKKEEIYEFDTQETLYTRLMYKGLDYFYEALDLVIKGDKGKRQKGQSIYYPRGCPHNGEINKKWDLEMKKRFIRAMTYPPYKPATLDQKNIFSIDNL